MQAARPERRRPVAPKDPVKAFMRFSLAVRCAIDACLRGVPEDRARLIRYVALFGRYGVGVEDLDDAYDLLGFKDTYAPRAARSHDTKSCKPGSFEHDVEMFLLGVNMRTRWWWAVRQRACMDCLGRGRIGDRACRTCERRLGR